MAYVIWDSGRGLFVRARQSYGRTTWTRDLGEAKVYSQSGAEASIKAIEEHARDLPGAPIRGAHVGKLHWVEVRLQIVGQLPGGQHGGKEERQEEAH